MPADYSNDIVARAYEAGEILKRCDRITLSSAANSITFNAVNESDRSTAIAMGVGVKAGAYLSPKNGTKRMPSFLSAQGEADKSQYNRCLRLWGAVFELEDQ